MKSVVALLLLVTVVAAKSSTNNIFCDVCVELVTAVEMLMEEEVPDIEAKADEFCDQSFAFNEVIDGMCKQMVNEEIETIENKLKHAEKPKPICEQLRMCTQNVMNPFHKQ